MIERWKISTLYYMAIHQEVFHVHILIYVTDALDMREQKPTFLYFLRATWALVQDQSLLGSRGV